MKMGWNMVLHSIRELTDAAESSEEEVEQLRFLVRQVPGVQECRGVRVRRMGTYSVADIQVAVRPLSGMDTMTEAFAIKDHIRAEALRHMPQLREITIELT